MAEITKKDLEKMDETSRRLLEERRTGVITRKSKLLAIVLRLTEEQQEKLERFLKRLLNIKS